MNFEYKHLLPADFNDDSRVWIYQSTRLFNSDEIFKIKELLTNFVTDWKSHGAPVKGYADLFFDQFVIFMADETAAGVSGCSTDSSIHLIKQIEKLIQVEMFNRQTLAFIVNNKIELIPLAQLNYALEKSFVLPNTPYFNNLVSTKKELANNWVLPVKGSWLKSKIKQPV